MYWKREEVHRRFANGKIEGPVLHNTTKKKFNLPHFKYKKYTGYWEIALFGELPHCTLKEILRKFLKLKHCKVIKKIFNKTKHRQNLIKQRGNLKRYFWNLREVGGKVWSNFRKIFFVKRVVLTLTSTTVIYPTTVEYYSKILKKF